jgi:outer membrane protein insertion porin family
MIRRKETKSSRRQNCLTFFIYCFLILVLPSLTALAQNNQADLTGLPKGIPTGLRIGSLDTAGNRGISRSDILAKVRSRAGDIFDPAVAAEDAKRISTLFGVQNSWYNTTVADGQVKLTFVIVEKNVVRSIEFVGNKKIKKSTLTKKLDFKKADYLDLPSAEAGREKIQDHYRQKGFAFATVSLDYEKLKTGNVLYTIEEGNRVKIASISYSGNNKLKTKDLKKVAKLRKKKFAFWPNYYVEEQLDKDVTGLLNSYYKRGFLNIKIEPQKAFSADGKSVKLDFIITEGNAYSVNKILFNGNKSFKEDKLLDAVKTQEGKVFNKLQGDEDVKELTRLYREQGFIDSAVEQEVKFIAEDKIDVEYVISEDEQFRLGQIGITGNQQTQDRVIRRILDEYDFTPGQFYNADIARGSPDGYLEKMIRQTAYTESATIVPVDTNQPGYKDSLVTIVEGKTGSIMAGAGVSADMGAVGQLVFEERNFDYKDRPASFKDFLAGKAFKGAGQHLRISLAPGTEVSQYSISFTEPYLKDKPLSLTLAASSWQRGWESYDESRLKGYVGFEKRYKDKWRRSIGLRAENVNVENLDYDAPKEIRDVKGKNFLAGVRLGINRDLTDDQFNPSKGYIFDMGYEQVAGDYTFGILSGFYQRFKTVSIDLADRKTVLSTKLYGATIVGNAPPFEKFYAGGSGTYYGIRGFEYRGVSTRGLPLSYVGGVPTLGTKKSDPIGSNWIALANSELIVPLVGDNLSWLVFVDSGMIDTGGVRASAGIGVQILIPQWFGPVPMRFELSTPFMKDGDDETQIFSFSIGRLF